MSTNVYRTEEQIYFDPDNPARFEGYHISTTSGCYSATAHEDTWAILEGNAKRIFPNCDTMRLAGFAFIAHLGNDYSDEAEDGVEEELKEGGYELEDYGSLWDAIQQIVNNEEQHAN